VLVYHDLLFTRKLLCKVSSSYIYYEDKSHFEFNIELTEVREFKVKRSLKFFNQSQGFSSNTLKQLQSNVSIYKVNVMKYWWICCWVGVKPTHTHTQPKK
jgi:hypothetical protein